MKSIKLFMSSLAIFAVAFMLFINKAAAANQSLTIIGNGNDSTSVIDSAVTSTTLVAQTNETAIKNDVIIMGNTGGNIVDGTTGGDVTVQTGKFKTDVEIDNQANGNFAEVESCACGETSVTAKIENNGTDTVNHIMADATNQTALIQANDADFDTKVAVVGNTGTNEVTGTTGGDVTVLTGNIKTDVNIENHANSNVGTITGSGEGESSEANLLIKKNGADSTSVVDIALDGSIGLIQLNDTGIDNGVGIGGNTGLNEAQGSTGGSVGIGTGKIDVDVNIDNLAGFNAGSVDCDCLAIDVTGAVKANGVGTTNVIHASLESASVLEQVNSCSQKPKSWRFKGFASKNDCFDNKVMLGGNTGSNQILGSTGEPETDPLILTGKTSIKVKLNNQGGLNTTAPLWLW